MNIYLKNLSNNNQKKSYKIIPKYNMIHIFGDSHGNFNFKNIKYDNIKNNYQNSITMYRE
jgi:hypothetical protein